MKNILVATDFSDNAHNAAVYAANLARCAGCRIILLHTYSIADMAAENEQGIRRSCIEKRRQAKMDRLAHELHDMYGVSVTRLLKPGFAADEIPALARRVKADVVVLACSCLQQLLHGETTAAILGTGQLAILFIPPLAVFSQAAGMAFGQEQLGNGMGKHTLVSKLQKVYGTGSTLQQPATETEELVMEGASATAKAAAATKSTLLLQLQPNQLLVIPADATGTTVGETHYAVPETNSLSHPVLVLPG